MSKVIGTADQWAVVAKQEHCCIVDHMMAKQLATIARTAVVAIVVIAYVELATTITYTANIAAFILNSSDSIGFVVPPVDFNVITSVVVRVPFSFLLYQS